MTDAQARHAETIERQFAVLRAIALTPGLSPDDLHAAVAELTGRTWAMATLYKDVAVLKDRGFLERGRNRQGYHLASSGFAPHELRVLLGGLRIQAEDLCNPAATALYDKILRRVCPNKRDQAFYTFPVEAIVHRPLARTSDDFGDVMDHLREPLLEGRAVGVTLRRNPWQPRRRAMPRFEVWPLQFIFHDVAWYLLAEEVKTRQFLVLRLDRIHPAITLLDGELRGLAVQGERQQLGRKLLGRGWAMAIPAHDARGRLKDPLETFELRFAPDAAPFIAEGQLRHDTQKMRRLPDGAMRFTVALPKDAAVIFQFRRWLLTWGRSCEAVGPDWFRERIAAEHAELVAAYTRVAAEAGNNRGILAPGQGTPD